VTRQLGRVPAEGDRVEIGDVTLAVTGATATRVTRVRVEHPGIGTEGESGSDISGSPDATGDDTE